MQALHYTRAAQLPAILAQRIVILDGAMGTMIQRFKLGEAQYRGEGYTGPDGAGDRFKDFPRDVKGSVSGTLQPATARTLRQALRGYPAMTLAIIARIHWHALQLWFKRVRFHRKPEAPASIVTR